jgi:hypothetical protein
MGLAIPGAWLRLNSNPRHRRPGSSCDLARPPPGRLRAVAWLTSLDRAFYSGATAMGFNRKCRAAADMR